MKALVAGPTGAIGSQLIQELCKNNFYTEITAITRRPLLYKSKKLKEFTIQSLEDLQKLNLEENIHLQADLLFCCLGTTIKTAGNKENFKKVDLDGVQILIALAERMQIKHFLLISAAGANKNSSFFYNKIKGQAEDLLCKSHIPNITIFRPGLLLTERAEFRLGERVSVKSIEFLQKYLPKNALAKIATKADALVHCMIKQSLIQNSGITIIEAVQIKQNL